LDEYRLHIKNMIIIESKNYIVYAKNRNWLWIIIKNM